MEIVTGWMKKGLEKGLEEGLAQGREQGIREGSKQGKLGLVLRLLRKRLGPLERDAEHRLGQISAEQLDQLAEALLEFRSRTELAAWLDAQPAQAR